MEDLDFNKFLDICKYHNANLFKKVVEGLKEGGCARSQLHVKWNISGIFILSDAAALGSLAG